MSVTTGDVVAQLFTTTNPATGAAADADSLPTGVLWVDGVANAAVVTIADAAGTGRYSFTVTMPTLTVGQRVQVVVDATIGGVACAGEVWADQCAPSANVTMQQGVSVAAADANGNVLAKLADGVIHGGWNSLLLLKLIDLRNYDPGGYAVYLLADDSLLGGGQAVFIRGTGLSKAIEIEGDIDADLTVSGLSSDAQQDVADALKLAPSAGAPEAGSVDAKLDGLPTDQDINDILAAGTVNSVAEGVSLATEAINVNTFDTSALQAIADAMGLAPTGAPAAGSLLASVAGIEEDTGVTLPATLAALPAAVDSELSGGHGAGAWGGAGAWPKPFVYTLTNTATGQTIAGALIEVYADIGMTALVDQGVTDAYGRVRFELPPGTYYFKRTKTGWDFTNPDTEVQA